jgi:ERCC4-type nuclease
MFNLYIDTREQGVIPFLFQIGEKFINIPYKITTLYAGDYAIFKGDSLLAVFERKTFSDLQSSMNDGRKENVNNLLDAREKTGCKLYYIIEGSPLSDCKKLYAHLDHLMVRDNIHILYTTNQQGTLIRLFELITNMTTLPQFQNVVGSDGDIFTKKNKTPSQISKEMWLCIGGISINFVDEIITILGSLNAFFNNEELYEIKDVKYPGGRKLQLSKIKKSRQDPKLLTKMLTCINGITSETAATILKNIELKDLNNPLQIENLIRPNGKKIGKKFASDVISLLLFKNDLNDL